MPGWPPAGMVASVYDVEQAVLVRISYSLRVVTFSGVYGTWVCDGPICLVGQTPGENRLAPDGLHPVSSFFSQVSHSCYIFKRVESIITLSLMKI